MVRLFYMIGFFIKKAFFDGWDNLIGLVLFNLLYILLFALGLWGFSTIGQYSVAGSCAFIIALLFIYAIISGGTSAVVHNYSNYQGDSWITFRNGIKRNIRHSLLFFLINILFAMNILFIIPFYLSMNNVFGLIVAVVLAWLEIFIFLSIAYYFPLMNLLPGDRPLKTFKKCFIIIGDNLGFTLFFVVYRIIVIVISVFTMGLIPGVVGAQLASQDSIKLLMLKYDYLEENKDADRKHLPWADILYDEKEKVGPRSLKNMIFPWK